MPDFTPAEMIDEKEAEIERLKAELKNEHAGRMLHEDLHDRWRTKATQLRAALRETREAFLICYAAVRDHADGECPCANILARYADLAGGG